MIDPKVEQAYRAALAADDEFQAALEAAYGDDAGDRRYGILPPELEAKGQAMREAADRYRKLVRAGRERAEMERMDREESGS